MVSPAPLWEMIAMEKIVCCSQFQRGRSVSHHTGTDREAPGELGGRGSKWEKVGRSLGGDFHGKAL